MTTTDASANPFELWKEMFQKSTEAWSQAAAGFYGFKPPAAGPMPFWPYNFGAAPGASAPDFSAFFQPMTPDALQKMWQQFFDIWAEQWSKNLSESPGFKSFQEAEKQWSEGLEAMADSFAKAMGTEEFSRMLGKSMEQSLVWQERMAKALNPQFDAALRACNMPSRSQIDRLFERIIGLEERLEEMEEQLRANEKNQSKDKA